ncbi:conserved protein, unknown function [Hepatocystis sp. ex Piliocolobus tephrosceles]|nr:conserved protein, unknown function [Hepatocystis sp. ex Piliocolobus tephrosceles]
MKIFIIFLFLFCFGYIESTKIQEQKYLDAVKKKVNRYIKRYKRSYNFKTKHIVGDYLIDANFFFNDKFEKNFKWNAYKSFCTLKFPYLCSYIKLRRKFNKQQAGQTKIKRFFSQINIMYLYFVHTHVQKNFEVKLNEDKSVVIFDGFDLTKIVNATLDTLTTPKEFEEPLKDPRWKLSFNYITGIKTLNIETPLKLPGITMTIIYSIKVYAHGKLLVLVYTYEPIYIYIFNVFNRI